MEWMDVTNGYLGVAAYFAENFARVKYGGKLVKIGTGPIQAVNFVTSGIDAVLAVNEGNKEFTSKDTDSAVWNYIAAGGFLVSAAGSGALAATFFAGAAGLSATGIGIAPGLVLAVIGSVIAIGSKTMADLANNTEMEDLLLKTPWGADSSFSIREASFAGVSKQYSTAVQILNAFSVKLDVDRQIAEIYLRRLEPETKITLKEIVFATSASGRYEEKAVGIEILLNTENANVTRSEQANCIRTNLSEICGTEYEPFWLANRPDYVKVRVQIDLFGNGQVILPDKTKSVEAHCYSGQKTECRTQ
jgi:hypothetical protein